MSRLFIIEHEHSSDANQSGGKIMILDDEQHAIEIFNRWRDYYTSKIKIDSPDTAMVRLYEAKKKPCGVVYLAPDASGYFRYWESASCR